MTSLTQLVRQIAVSADGNAVRVELICADGYAAEVLADDLLERLKTDRCLQLTILVGDVLERAR